MPKASARSKAGQITREGLLASPWPGFTVPRYTQVPDEVFDVLMPVLTEAEFKCLCYICRRTFGFRKESDAISLNQMADGITTRDGRVLDRGTGMSRASVKKALSFLVKAGVVEVEKRMSEEGEYETNVYSLRIASAGDTNSSDPSPPPSRTGVGQNIAHHGSESNQAVGQNLSHRRTESIPPVGQNLSSQERDTQETDNNNTSLPHVVVPLTYKTKTALLISLVDLGIRKTPARRLIDNHGLERVARVMEYALYRLSKGWKPDESLPGWIVSAITEEWEIPSWFRTADEMAREQHTRKRNQTQQARRLEAQRRKEEAEMTKQRARTLRSLGITKGTDLLWTKINDWLRERGLWRPALSTAALARVTEDQALVLCGYAFSLELVKDAADVIGEALGALTGTIVQVDVQLEERLFTLEE